MHMSHEVMVKKASGVLEPFSPEKLRRSLEKSGADQILADEIVEHISDQLYNGVPTSEIHDRAFVMLKSHRSSFAARYNVKQAIFALGPSGFAFEQFVGRLFNHMGYETEIGVSVRGKCVQHEVDVVLTKGALRGYAECKFHNLPGLRCGVKTPLYVFGRFEDICRQDGISFESREREGWLVTNTRFTDDALAYGSCVGLKMLGWNTGPLGESIERLIDVRKLHPITCLTSLSAEEKRQLLTDGIILCVDLLVDGADWKAYFSKETLAKVLVEARELCGHDVI